MDYIEKNSKEIDLEDSQTHYAGKKAIKPRVKTVPKPSENKPQKQVAFEDSDSPNSSSTERDDKPIPTHTMEQHAMEESSSGSEDEQEETVVPQFNRSQSVAISKIQPKGELRHSQWGLPTLKDIRERWIYVTCLRKAQK